jgi:hypothetical protein
MQVTYPDKWLRIIAYPFLGFVIRHFGEYASIGSLMKTPLYYGDLFWDTLIVATCWEANRSLIFYLDARYPWAASRLQRLVIQTGAAILLTVPIVAGMIYLWNEVLIHRPGNFDTAYLLVYDFPLTLIFTTLIHMVYTGMYFHGYYTQTILALERRISELENNAVVKSPSDALKGASSRDVIIVDYGSASVPLQTQDIACICKMHDLCLIKTFEGKEYSSSSSLENLEALLDPSLFFRLNRQVLAHIRSIRKFRTDGSGKLLIELEPSLPATVTVSKKKALEFKSWMGQRV